MVADRSGARFGGRALCVQQDLDKQNFERIQHEKISTANFIGKIERFFFQMDVERPGLLWSFSVQVLRLSPSSPQVDIVRFRGVTRSLTLFQYFNFTMP